MGYDEREKAANDAYRYERAYENSHNRQYINRDAMHAELERVAALGKTAQESMKAFDKTPLGKLENMKDTINTGRNAISKFLSTAASKIKPSNNISFTNKYRTIGHEKVYKLDKNDKWKRIYKLH